VNSEKPSRDHVS